MANLKPIAEALAQICSDIAPLPIQSMPLSMASGRLLEDDIIAGTHHPLADMSAMDGYGVRASDTTDGSVLSVIGESAAGHPYTKPLGPNQAVRIYTGAYVPEGCDSIILQEEVSENNNIITPPAPLQAGRFIRKRGQDFARDDILVPKGTILNARAIALSALGLQSYVKVRKKPHIAIISSGDELVSLGAIPKFGQLINSNAVFLSQALSQAGAQVTDLGILPDEPGALSSVLSDPSQFDLIVTTGGASVGKYDHIVSDLETSSDMALDFWKIAMRPGKPLIYGHIGQTPLIGLPGNPVSVAICTLVFLRPVLGHMMGVSHLNIEPQTAICDVTLGENDQRQDYLRAIATKQNNKWSVMPFDKQDSAMMKKLAMANAVIIRPPFDKAIQSGDEVQFALLPDGF